MINVLSQEITQIDAEIGSYRNQQYEENYSFFGKVYTL